MNLGVPRLRTKAWLILGVLAFAGSIYACQVPVFRYALERWEADRYEVLVLHQGELSTASAEALEFLQEAGAKSESGFGVRVVAIDSDSDPALQQLWKERSPNAEPIMAVLYPANSQVPGRLAHCGPLTIEHARRLLDSPVRRSLIDKLQSGDSAVWVFVPCGNKAKDEAAYQILQKQLIDDAEWIQLPTPEELEVSSEVIKSSKIELRIDFSIVQLDREDPDEQFVLDALLNSESDLRDFDEPMAFPVFGRGRVLYALIGKGISPDTIRAATSFITGPCSCQVKNQNPGFDLLLSNDWKGALGDVLISEPIPTVSAQPRLLSIPPGRQK